MPQIVLQALLWTLFVAWVIAGVILALQPALNKIAKYLNYISAFAGGLLLGIVFFGFVPSLGQAKFPLGDLWMLVGILFFYALEILFHWHHCKDIHEDWTLCSHHLKEHTSWALMSLGTFLHNFIHWVVLLGAFASGLQIWIATTLAVALHAIPQNLANFLMNHKNFKYVWIAVGATILGGLVMVPLVDQILAYKPVILAIVAWGLLYIALSDVLPELSEHATPSQKLVYLLLALAWIATFWILQALIS